MGLDRKNKRALDRFTKNFDKELQRSAKRNIKPISAEFSGSSGAFGPPPITNVYGNTVHVHGDGNQLAVGNEGDVQQFQGEQPLDLAKLQDVLRDLHASNIEFGDSEVETMVAEIAEEVRGEIESATPDHGRLRELVTALANYLRTVPTTAVGGFIAQGLTLALLPAG
ncbi:hypothetical protein [Saccharopolyspora sp. NPDC049357]|uniref:hypothetical protein n=1 Tax=Saccharopolyspora sp. NPDC049357 TaxID=3154507 RepID=UPI0034377233